jgi:hypothetical protein
MSHSALSALMGKSAPKPSNQKEKHDVVEDAKAELSELQQAFKAKTIAEKARFERATDTEYWVALCFQSRQEKEDFLRAANLMALGDKYIDGRKAAKRLNVPVEFAESEWKESKPNGRWGNLVRKEPT